MKTATVLAVAIILAVVAIGFAQTPKLDPTPEEQRAALVKQVEQIQTAYNLKQADVNRLIGEMGTLQVSATKLAETIQAIDVKKAEQEKAKAATGQTPKK
jgi:hypothetical protein